MAKDRDIWLKKNGGKTIICFFCKEEITRLSGYSRKSLAIHHHGPKRKKIVPVHVECHVRHHHGGYKNEKPTPHGKPSTYINYDCRCSECRKAWAKYVQRYRTTGQYTLTTRR